LSVAEPELPVASVPAFEVIAEVPMGLEVVQLKFIGQDDAPIATKQEVVAGVRTPVIVNTSTDAFDTASGLFGLVQVIVKV
jgi:hypothetical protein